MLKNYTSTVPVERTLAKIESALVAGGAQTIVREYDTNQQVQAFTFALKVNEKNIVSFRLPADAEAVYQKLASKVKRPQKGTLNKIKDQAHRTAWALMLDWVLVQMSLVSLGQAETMQVFLPYAWNGRHTLYAQLKSQNFERLLTAG